MRPTRANENMDGHADPLAILQQTLDSLLAIKMALVCDVLGGGIMPPMAALRGACSDLEDTILKVQSVIVTLNDGTSHGDATRLGN